MMIQNECIDMLLEGPTGYLNPDENGRLAPGKLLCDLWNP